VNQTVPKIIAISVHTVNRFPLRFVAIVTWQMPHVEQELLSLPEHLSSSLVLVGLCCSIFQCSVLLIIVPFLLTIVLSVLWFTTSDYPFGSVCKICQSCQTWLAKFGEILLRTDTRLLFCNRKLMRTDIFFTRTTYVISWTLLWYLQTFLIRKMCLLVQITHVHVYVSSSVPNGHVSSSFCHHLSSSLVINLFF
jgi:hypothetical protein